MLPKAEKPLKTLTTPIPAPKNQKLVIICLGLTIFLSLSFLIYRKIIPILNGSKPIVIDFSFPSNHNFKDIPSSWSIYVGQYSNNLSSTLYSNNFNQPPDPIITQLKSIPPTSNSSIRSALPQGVTISEIDADPQSINFQYLITLPQLQLVMVLQNPTRSQENLKLIPQIASTLYWDLVGSR